MTRTLFAAALVCMTASTTIPRSAAPPGFADEVAFLKHYVDVIVLSDERGSAKVAVAPAWQGRVMTSTAGGDAGASFGWINRELIASGKLQPHINVFGGEDRFWLGPEGGQFSIFFAKGAKFELADWQTPATIDTLPFKVVSQSRIAAMFGASFALTNYSGTSFDVTVDRDVQLLEPAGAWKRSRRRAGQGRHAGRLRIGQPHHQRRQAAVEEGDGPAVDLDPRHVQSLAGDHHRRADPGRARTPTWARR